MLPRDLSGCKGIGQAGLGLWRRPWSQPAQLFGPVIGTGDFDGDLDPDLLAWEPEGRGLVVWRLDGAAWAGDAPLVPAFPTDRNLEPIATGEFNGDSSDDLLYQNAISKRLVVWFMAGTTRICGIYFDPDKLVDPLYPAWSVVAPR